MRQAVDAQPVPDPPLACHQLDSRAPPDSHVRPSKYVCPKMLLHPSLAVREPTARDVIWAVRRFSRTLLTDLDRNLAEVDLSFAQFEVLAILFDDPNIHSAAIGRRLRISRQAAHSLVKELTRERLIRRRAYDNGVIALQLTKRGRERALACLRATTTVDSALERVPSAVLRSLLDSIQTCDDALDPVPAAWWLD